MWPFTRKPKPINPGPINEDWRVGDLAEDIGDGQWIREDGSPSPGGIKKGDVLRVTGALPVRTVWGDLWMLEFAGIPREAFSAAHFRKVPPLNSEATAEFTAQIRKLAHRKAPAA